nr:uncharacterized protein LOC100180038 isoform X2 [Ciona intestinalis]|eukprot:XP_026694191.1 uncharacterized protein LOC100180038 isoform X2 [Ciona intestinalis]
MISGSITKTSDRRLNWFKSNKAMYFCSIPGEARLEIPPNSMNYERNITTKVLARRSDGAKFYGKVFIKLMLPQDDGVWNGSFELQVDDESIKFNEVERTSLFFRDLQIDIDYVDRVVWPTIKLSDFHDAPEDMKDRKLDPFAVFEDAGIKLHYESSDSDEISDPTPDNPWTKDDMYEVMMEHFDSSSNEDATSVWCMMANVPPDPRYMGFSFNKDNKKGFGMFKGHKSFEGLMDPSSEDHPYATRRFLHYFIHECGHTMGLMHPFELNNPSSLTWMNYSWKYNAKYGPGEFYDNFNYSFSNIELQVLRHIPSKGFKAVAPNVRVTNYGKVSAAPAEQKLGEQDEYEEENKVKYKLSLRAVVEDQEYAVDDSISLELRLKNTGEFPVLIESDFDPMSGNMKVFIIKPNGEIELYWSFVTHLQSSTYQDPIILQPSGTDGSDRYSDVVQIGEGTNGPVFSEEGTYKLYAVYIGLEHNIVSEKVDVVIRKADVQDKLAKALNVGSFLGGAKQIGNFWGDFVSKAAAFKKNHINKVTAFLGDLVSGEGRSVVKTRKRGRKGKAKKEISRRDALKTTKDVFADTADMVQYYHGNGAKGDNIKYKKLVLTRAKIAAKVGFSMDKMEVEFNQMLADLVKRGVKYAAIQDASKQWEQIKNPTPPVDQNSKENLQNKFEQILDWYPDNEPEGEDMSGIGLGKPFSNFSIDHLTAGASIARLLFDKLDETHDVAAVLEYADILQKSYKVNHHVLHWAVEVFVVHSKRAKSKGLQYPVPKPMDKSLISNAAMTVTQRTGQPAETWMNYWRNDADLNYHHRHWHVVYVVGQLIGQNLNWFGRWRTERPELFRQGELFGYMHAQMLARYNAERQSWRLPVVQAWQYNERDPVGYNTGFEFHNDRRNRGFSPRLPGSFPDREQTRFQRFERAIMRAINADVLPPVVIGETTRNVAMDANWAGHVIEASSSTWQAQLGSIHNNGHGVIGSMSRSGSSYMSATVTAMRDPIFYRWHKRIDNLWQEWSSRRVTDLQTDAPAVIIRPSDIIISNNANPPRGFNSFSNTNFQSDDLQTYLGPPQKRYEWDNKISHQPFTYHIRFQRASQAQGELNLTVRIFICPASESNNRLSWIEMDKFVYRLGADATSAVISRPDRHSSVIKRERSYMEGDVEENFTTTATGFCECGWPYSMLLPRGTEQGEQWRLCVFLSDNNVDSISVRSSCGSMSFCGSSGQAYPDRRMMGYPFATRVSLGNNEMAIENAMSALQNASISSFIIKNNVTISPPVPAVDAWSPWVQMAVDDGMNETSTTVASFRSDSPSGAGGVFRILIDDAAMTLTNFNTIRVRFQGRGEGFGAYGILSAYVGVQRGNSLNLRQGSNRPPITVNGQSSFTVPETGIISDEMNLGESAPVDLFVTFTLQSPGCFLRPADDITSTSTYAILQPTGDVPENWQNLEDVRTSTALYCIGGIMTPLSST